MAHATLTSVVPTSKLQRPRPQAHPLFLATVILNTASPISARKTRLFVPHGRNFDKDASVEETHNFKYQVFAEDIAIVESKFPEDLPLKLHDEAHFPPTAAPSPTAKASPPSVCDEAIRSEKCIAGRRLSRWLK